MARVLVFDDDASTAELMRVVLDDAGLDVAVALAADELAHGPFDCVVSDLMLTTVYTYEVAQAWLRRLAEQYQGTPVILVTAHSEAAGDRDRLTAWRVIMKPFDVDQLAAAVREAVRSGPATS